MTIKMLVVSLGMTMAAAPLLASAQYGGQYGGNDGYRDDGRGSVIRCESKDGRRNSCGVDARGDVRLIRQLSDSRCDRGRTWGTDNRGVWVDGGCRAEFSVSNDNARWDRRRGGDRDGRGDTIGYGGGVQVLRCESNDKRNHQCSANIRRGVSLQRQLSGSPCIEGRTWGWDRGGVWVDQGCRGEFAVR